MYFFFCYELEKRAFGDAKAGNPSSSRGWPAQGVTGPSAGGRLRGRAEPAGSDAAAAAAARLMKGHRDASVWPRHCWECFRWHGGVGKSIKKSLKYQ